MISEIVFRQKKQMIIFVLARFFVESRAGSHIDFASDNRNYPLLLGFLIKCHAAVHRTVVRDGGMSHSEFLDSFYVFFYLVRPVQKAVFRMDVKVCKSHFLFPFF